MKTPHKHAEVIKAWADGAQVEYRSHLPSGEWIETQSPDWLEDYEYRIKPEPRKGWYRVALMRSGDSANSYRYTAHVGNPDWEAMLASNIDFIRWLTPRTEYEVD